MEQPATQKIEPNLYELSCDGTTLTYSTSSIDGRSRLSYSSGDRSYVFSGEEIRTSETEIGRLVTVTLDAVPDLEVVTLSLLLPPINLINGESRLETMAIVTTHRTSIGGPRLVQGQVLSYAPIKLHGVARGVVF